MLITNTLLVFISETELRANLLCISIGQKTRLIRSFKNFSRIEILEE